VKKLKGTIRILLLIIVAGFIGCAGDNYTHSFVYTIEEKPTAYNEADRLGIWFPASDFEVVGIYLPPRQPIKVSVKKLKGNTEPKLLVGTYSRYKAEDVPTVYDLVAGNNTVTDSAGGLLYLQYVTDGNPSGKVEVTFSGGEPIPVYRLGETTHGEWLQMLESMTFTDVHMISNRTMVTVSKEIALKYKDLSQDEMLKTLDRISDIEDNISGIDGSSPLHQPNVHKQLITETADTNMFLAAEEHRIMVISSACERIMDPKRLSGNSWGLWHEMGHMRQALNWDWDEVDEVTVNIYSLAVLYAFEGDLKWLKGQKIWDVLADYFQLPLEDRNFNKSRMLKGKGRLAMFRQLWMAYGDEFYIKVHKLAREENAKPNPRVKPRYESTGDEQMAHFMLLASKASGHNLNNFFTQWGFKLPQKDFDALDDLGLPEPTIDLLRLRE